MQHSNLPPVLDTYVVDGNEIRIRYRDAWGNLCRNYINRLPQNSTMPKVTQHAIVETVAEKVGA
jgi:hypothetical protein